MQSGGVGSGHIQRVAHGSDHISYVLHGLGGIARSRFNLADQGTSDDYSIRQMTDGAGGFGILDPEAYSQWQVGQLPDLS